MKKRKRVLNRILRGGGWFHLVGNVRSARRAYTMINGIHSYVGFRIIIAKEIKNEKKQ